MRLGVAAAVLDGAIVRGDVEVTAGRVTAAGLAGGGGGLAAPGLVDLQVNGYAGVDLLAAEAGDVAALAGALARDGVLWYQPTLITAPPDATRDALAVLGAVPDDGRGARSLGAHLEGPFLAPSRRGAHPAAWLREPSLDLLASFLVAGCEVSMVTLAPELPGADEAITALVERGVTVSLGHTDATAAVAHAAFDLGATAVTHVFDAMRPLAHRDPGLAGAALARPEPVVTAIADGVHLAPEALLLVWRAARGRLALVSDAIPAATLGDGRYRLGAVEVEVEDGVARAGDGALAGAVRPLAWGLRALVEFGVPIPEAVDAVTRTPARLVRREDAGRLTIGGEADLVVLDDDFGVSRVLRAGVEVS